MTIPENRKKLLEQELEKERRLTLKEAKAELWKKWAQNKGRGQYRKKTKKEEEVENLEKKLEMTEKVAREYEEILEKEMVEIQDKAETKQKRIEKEGKAL